MTKNGAYQITAKTEQTIRKTLAGRNFWQAEKKANRVITVYFKTGQGDELNPETGANQFGDALDSIDYTGQPKNALSIMVLQTFPAPG